MHHRNWDAGSGNPKTDGHPLPSSPHLPANPAGTVKAADTALKNSYNWHAWTASFPGEQLLALPDTPRKPL